MNNIKLKNKFAFTLAEVLITLGIIGVVAAMSIPTLINDTQDRSYKTALKKAYSEIMQAHSLIKMDNSGFLTKDLYSTPDDFRDLFSNYFKTARKCDSPSASNKCWNSVGGLSKDTRQVTPSPGAAWWFGTTRSTFSLQDGKNIMIDVPPAATCTKTTDATVSECGRIYIDVNGDKGPNTWGKDIYWFDVYSDKITAHWGTKAECDTGWGGVCAFYYLSE